MNKPVETVTIREIEPADAEITAELSAELGYPVTSVVMRERIGVVRSSNTGVIYVALVSNAVVGWIDVCTVHHLTSGLYAEIGGFIVSKDHQSRGIGGQLIARAERWALDQGVIRLLVRSRVTRQDAHRFYLGAGYSMTKTSSVFTKQLRALNS